MENRVITNAFLISHGAYCPSTRQRPYRNLAIQVSPCSFLVLTKFDREKRTNENRFDEGKQEKTLKRCLMFM